MNDTDYLPDENELAEAPPSERDEAGVRAIVRRLAPHADAIAVALLVGLWLLFFWRLLTPVVSDQASLVKGDFSGQFVTFGAYQYQRLSAGEVPLWDPYNNGGLPFIADTQAAVFYPPRLLTIFLARLSGGWSYHALELEMTLHILAYTLMMYLLVRRMTMRQTVSGFKPESKARLETSEGVEQINTTSLDVSSSSLAGGFKLPAVREKIPLGSILGAFVAAVIAGYGGFMTGYPPLQLAILEAGIWLPLAVLGIFQATRGRGEPAVHPYNTPRWPWLILTGFALGLSWMAGHPQTSLFLTYLLAIYFAYCCYARRYRWPVFIAGTVLFGLIAGGLAAVQLLPGFEYLGRTTRTALTYDAKGNGFPLQDIIQIVFPAVTSVWSPLYIGLVGLILALIAIWRKQPQSRFWGLIGLVALGLSFGENGVIFPLLYNLLPGLRFFREQERAAYLVANSGAILAGLGIAHLAEWDVMRDYAHALRTRIRLQRLFMACFALTALVLVAWIGKSDAYGKIIGPMVFITIIAGLLFLLIPWLMTAPRRAPGLILLTGLLVVELFTINMANNSDYEAVPPDQQISMTPPPLVAQALADPNVPFRVDGSRGLGDNNGSLYSLADIHGISPLFMDGPHTLIETPPFGSLGSARAWELFAVRYVYSDWQQLPVPSEIVGNGIDRYGAINLHRLTDPRPFALLMYDAAVIGDDDDAYDLLADANFNPRRTVILQNDPGITFPDKPPAPLASDSSTAVTDFKPESFTIRVNAPSDAVLSVANPDYPGWQATVDDQPTPILRAYGALQAIVVHAGQHVVRFVYDPMTYRVGAIISAITWLGLAIVAVALFVWSRRNSRQSRAGAGVQTH